MVQSVLYITSNKISGKNGGSVGQRKILESLKHAKDTNLISDYRVISPDSFSDVEIKKTKMKDILSRVFLHSNYLFIYKRVIKKYMKSMKPDLVLIGNSRLGFLLNKKMNNVTHFDNVEFDYAEHTTKGNGILSFLKKRLEKFCVKRDERKSLKMSKCIFTLSERDYDRLVSIYGLQSYHIIYPVCLNESEVLPKNSNQQSFIFTGTLNYLPNIEAVQDLISIKNKINIQNLIIAGSNPSDELKALVNNVDGICTYYNFNSYLDFASFGDVLVSPLVNGSGMKVKVAEAMSMGLIVCGTSETFVGYDQAFKMTKGLFVCNTEEEFENAILKIQNMSKEEIYKLAESNLVAFKALYSMDVSFRIFEEMLVKL